MSSHEIELDCPAARFVQGQREILRDGQFKTEPFDYFNCDSCHVSKGMYVLDSKKGFVIGTLEAIDVFNKTIGQKCPIQSQSITPTHNFD